MKNNNKIYTNEIISENKKLGLFIIGVIIYLIFIGLTKIDQTIIFNNNIKVSAKVLMILYIPAFSIGISMIFSAFMLINILSKKRTKYLNIYEFDILYRKYKIIWTNMIYSLTGIIIFNTFILITGIFHQLNILNTNILLISYLIILIGMVWIFERLINYFYDYCFNDF